MPTEKSKEKSSDSDEPIAGYTDWNQVDIKFKNPDFQHSFMTSSKNKTWRNLKQICSQEQQALQQQQQGQVLQDGRKDYLTYWGIDAPPSFKPAKKYSDISGLHAKYTDPQTKLNYTDAEEFKVIRKMPSDLVAGYLALRKANTQLQ